MFTQKSPTPKLGDAYSLLIVPFLFIVGGLLLSRHAPLALVFVVFVLPMLAVQLMLSVKRAACPASPENALLADSHNIEWRQVVGKDGEVVEVGHVKQRPPSIQSASLTNSG